MATPSPRGYLGWTAALGIKDSLPDFAAVLSAVPAASASVYTRSRFAGPSVLCSRESAANGTVRGVVVLARNANVATGAQGLANAREVRELVAARAGVPAEEQADRGSGAGRRRRRTGQAGG